MQIIPVTLPRDHELAWIACTHEGNPNQHEEGIEDAISYVERGSNRKAVLVGDLVEGITPRDRRFEYGSHTMSITEQCQKIKARFRRIKGKILVAGRGNHESAIKDHGDIIRDVFCKDLGIPYGTVSFKLVVSDPSGKLMYKAFATHPHSGSIGSSSDNPILRDAMEKVQLMRRLCREMMGDCILNMAAHFHKAITVDPRDYQKLYLVDDGEKIKQRYVVKGDPTAEYIDEYSRWFGSIPGWVRKYGELGTDGYVERAGYNPLPLGYLKTVTRDGKIVAMEEALVQ